MHNIYKNNKYSLYKKKKRKNIISTKTRYILYLLINNQSTFFTY
jgi:hypothetical protein